MINLNLRAPKSNSVIYALQNYSRAYPQERALVADYISFLTNTNEKPFHRTNLARHITGSAWLISSTRDEVLLTHHQKLNRWLQLGGHCDGSPNVLNEAIREAEEESGIRNIQCTIPEIFDIDKHLIPARADEPEHFHYDIRFLLTAPTNKFTVSTESRELKWVHINDPFFQSFEAKDLAKMHHKWKNAI